MFHHYPNESYDALTLYPCRECSEVFHDPKALTAHTLTTHKPTRTKINSKIIQRHLLMLDDDKCDHALPLLQARLTVKPPDFRPNEFLDLDQPSSDLTTSTKNLFVEVFLDSTIPLHTRESEPIYEHREDPLLF